MPSWFSDFTIKNKTIYVKSTGAILPLEWSIIAEALAWFPFFLVEKAKKLTRIFSKKTNLRIAFIPEVPRPWYMLWVCAHRADVKIVTDPQQADAVFYFEDQTRAAPPVISTSISAKIFNFNCNDISKSHVGAVFKHVFGYDLAVDPQDYQGPIAVKSEINGLHDGYAAQGPLNPKEGFVYQKLIENTVDGLWAEDLRCPIVGGDIDIVFIKRRALKNRFANINASVTLASPDDVFSQKERSTLKEFAKAMGLDWGGMDVLRDKKDGKIYVVDVNKTEMGPPISLSLQDKNKAATILTRQFLNLIENGSQTP